MNESINTVTIGDLTKDGFQLIFLSEFYYPHKAAIDDMYSYLIHPYTEEDTI